MNYIITRLMARDSTGSMERNHEHMKEDRIKALVDEVLVDIKCTGGSENSD